MGREFESLHPDHLLQAVRPGSLDRRDPLAGLGHPGADAVVQCGCQPVRQAQCAGHQPGAGVLVVARLLLQIDIRRAAGRVQLVRVLAPGGQRLLAGTVAAGFAQALGQVVQFVGQFPRQFDSGADQPALKS